MATEDQYHELQRTLALVLVRLGLARALAEDAAAAQLSSLRKSLHGEEIYFSKRPTKAERRQRKQLFLQVYQDGGDVMELSVRLGCSKRTAYRLRQELAEGIDDR